MSRNGFEIFDRYDFAMWLLLGLLMAGAVVLGAPLLLTVVAVMFAGSIAGFIRHFDEFMEP